MGFASGSVSFRRYFICGDRPMQMSEELLDALAGRAFGRGGLATSDGIETGWILPTHLFDTDFADLGRISAGPFTFVAMRMDRTKPPAALIRSYRRMEEEAALAASDREHLSRQERLQAKEAAEARAEEEARAGMFRRISAYPVLIDWEEGQVYFGNLGSTAGDKLVMLFSETFELTLMPASVDELSHRIAERRQRTADLDALEPLHLARPAEFADEALPDAPTDLAYLGREFLTWLWHRCDMGEGIVELPEGRGSALIAIEKLMEAHCASGVTGTTIVRTDAPTSASEARAALRGDKQPVRMRLLLAVSGDEYALTLDGPKWTISSLAVPAGEEEDPVGRLEERLAHIRRCGRSLDQMFESFLALRLGGDWSRTEEAMRKWVDSSRRGSGADVHRVSA